MRVQLHFEIKEDDGRLWFKRYFIEGFPALPHLYDFIEGASILKDVEEDGNLLTNLDSKIYFIAQIVWLKDESGIYPLLVCSEKENTQDTQ